MTFGSAYEGPPGCVHGGFVAAAFDEVLGFVQSLGGQPGLHRHAHGPLPQPDTAPHRAALQRRDRPHRGPQDLRRGHAARRRPALRRGRGDLHHGPPRQDRGSPRSAQKARGTPREARGGDRLARPPGVAARGVRARSREPPGPSGSLRRSPRPMLRSRAALESGETAARDSGGHPRRRLSPASLRLSRASRSRTRSRRPRRHRSGCAGFGKLRRIPTTGLAPADRDAVRSRPRADAASSPASASKVAMTSMEPAWSVRRPGSTSGDTMKSGTRSSAGVN